MVRGTHEGTSALHLHIVFASFAHNRRFSGLQGLQDRFSNLLKSHNAPSAGRRYERPFSTRRAHRRVSLFVAFTVVASVLLIPLSYGTGYGTGAQQASAAGLDGATATSPQLPPPPSATPVPVVPLSGPEQPAPYLVATTKISPRTVSVGETFTATIVVENHSEYAANNVSIELALPAGVTRASNPSAGNYSWQEASLGANEALTSTATLRLVQAQPGGAIVLRPEVSASNAKASLTSVGGALVVERNQAPNTARFAPGSPASLRSPDSRVEVTLPPNASTRALTLRYGQQPKPGSGESDKTGEKLAGRKWGFEPFYLNATDDTGAEVHDFSAPVTIEASYTPQQLEALGISEGDLSFFWFDASAPGSGQWVPIPTDVDTATRTATAQVNHFSNFKLGDGSSPSEAYIPSLQGWQVSLYTGAVSYQYPIEVPAGPGGVKPSVSLSYSSGSSDGLGGEREKQQAGWVGKGWSLDTGSIALNRRGSDRTSSRYYTLVFNGRSFDLVRGAPRVGTPSLTNPTHWEWKSTDESFIRVRAEGNGLSTATRGGYFGATALPRYKWQVWTPDGTRYDFEEDAWQGFVTQEFGGCAPGQSFMETYKWHLTRVEDTHGNRINYGYARESGWRAGACDGVQGTVDWTVWPTEITWGQNINVSGSIDRYRVGLVSSLRSVDTQWDAASNQLGPAPYEKRRLDVVKVHSKQAAAWELVREYRLCYAGMAAPCPAASNLLSDNSVDNYNNTYSANAGYPKITLTGIQQVGSDGETVNPPSALPLITFAYGTNDNDNNDRGTGYYPKGDWNRLTAVNNGQGGTITFNYENIGAATNIGLLRNYRRVTSKVVGDGRGNSYPWNYTYTNPAMNTIGAIVDAGHGPNQYPNSATVWFHRFYPATSVNGDLIHKAKSEFRGHGKVVERNPNNNETEHFFYQGDVGCAPSTSTSGNAITNDACFQQMRNREFLKGREYQTITYQGLASAVNKLSEVLHTFSVNFLSDGADAYADDRFTGLWRAYSNESETIEKTWEGTTTPISNRTTYSFDGNTGNLLSTTEYDATGVAYRTTEHSYKTLNTATSYILDRKRKDTVRQGGTTGPFLAHTIYGWDGSLGGPETLTKGELTLVRKYYNLTVPPSTSFPATGLSTDTSYTYDLYGNQKTTTTYTGYGQTTNMNTTPSYGAAGGGGSNTARITTTDYDSVFKALPVKITPPVAALAETANYDSYGMRMGLMTSVLDPNGQTTYVRYDAFGRLAKLIKPGDLINPGDTDALPTVEASYWNYDAATGKPFEYRVYKRENTSTYWALLPTQLFYDGMGRQIQSRSESIDGGQQSLVVDKVYDGLSQVVKQSTPRYVPNFWGYQPVSSDPNVMLWNTTQYDALGRATRVTSPDSTYTEMSYGVRGNQHKTVSIDAKRHKKAHYSDVFGRLVEVGDYVNETDATAYSTTTYGYSALDLLTSVLDANGKSITVNYDSLGRKTSMSDPSMGNWSYAYHANGQLQRQNDAKGQWIEFDYDSVDRLWQKRYSDSTRVQYWYDGGVAGYYNAGQRTIMARYAANGHEVAAAWFNYDVRGRQAKVDYRTGQLSAALRTFTWAYDSGDRMTNMTYPSGETVAYTYDAMWRQTSVCGTTCYASGAQYNALAQPTSFTLGNGLVQGYEYQSLTQRLWKLRVGTAANPTSISSRTYGYDAVGNVEDLNSTTTGENQHFTYDHLDRLNGWTVNSGATTTVSQAYTYDKLGNILTKGGTSAPTTYNYNLSATTNGGPYALRSLNGGTQFAYDANGNMTSSPATPFGDPARSLSWNVENLPVSITSGGVTESYTYDADGERASRSVTQNSVTTSTYYFGGLYEEDAPSGNTRSLYTLNGQVVAQREFVPTPPTPTNTPTNTSTPTNTPTPTPTQVPNAQFVSQSVPTTMDPGGVYNVSITMYNNGVATWNAGESFALWTEETKDWEPDYVTVGANVAPGQSYTFNFTVTAPSPLNGSGTYTFQWRMAKPGASFGQASDPVSVQVGGSNPCPFCESSSAPAEPAFELKRTSNDGSSERAGGRGDQGGADNSNNGNWEDGVTPSESAEYARYESTITGGGIGSAQTLRISLERVANVTNKGRVPGGTRGARVLQVGGGGTGTSTVVYLHSDHLGSVSTVTNQIGAVVSSQQFDPWGKVRTGGISATKVNYTGQHRDDTGLLYYHARYYDPGLARFVSADTIVPMGWGEKSSLRPLTVNFNVRDFLVKTNSENAFTGQKGFWFQLSWLDRQHDEAKVPWGPKSAQALNRYSYVQNNPLRYTDPTGCTECYTHQEALAMVGKLRGIAKDIRAAIVDSGYNGYTNIFQAILTGFGGFGAVEALKALGVWVSGAIGVVIGAVAYQNFQWKREAVVGFATTIANYLDSLADAIEQMVDRQIRSGRTDQKVCITESSDKVIVSGGSQYGSIVVHVPWNELMNYWFDFIEGGITGLK